MPCMTDLWTGVASLGGVPKAGMASEGLMGGPSELSKCIGQHYGNVTTTAFTAFSVPGVIPFNPHNSPVR